ncbi:MAG: DUF2752 domain-containing protein [Planctomycetota bacterium]|jgi:hypothetical protein
MSTYVHSESTGAVPTANGATAARFFRRRLKGAAVALPCWAVLTLAVALAPDAAGYGTHEQAGMQQCSFMVRHGLPCPTCGLTTSVSAAVHGQLGLAARAQPFGIVLTAAMAVFAIVGTVELSTGRPWLVKLRPRLWWLWVGISGVLAGWAVVLAVGYARGMLPLH